MKKLPVSRIQVLSVVEGDVGGTSNPNQPGRKTRRGYRNSKKEEANALRSLEATPIWYRAISRSAYRLHELCDDFETPLFTYFGIAHIGTFIWFVSLPDGNLLSAVLGTVFGGWFVSLLFFLPTMLVFAAVLVIVDFLNFVARHVAYWKRWEVSIYQTDAEYFAEIRSKSYQSYSRSSNNHYGDLLTGILLGLGIGFLFSDDSDDC